MKYSEFEDELLVAAYQETEIQGDARVSSGDLLDRYPLRFREGWVHRAIEAFSSRGLIRGKGTIGGERSQPIGLTGAGMREAERLIDQGVAIFRLDVGDGVGFPPSSELPTGVTDITGGRVFMSEGPIPTDLPGQVGDMYIELEPTEAPVDSSRWTGLPRVGILSTEATEKLRLALSTVDDAIEKAGCSNEEKAQARAYALAVHALADAPEPPADLIWQLINRANSMAGIASLFVSLLALFN